MQFVIKVLAVVSGAIFVLGFSGRWLPMGDSFAVIRLPVAVVFAIAVTWTNWPARVRWPLSALPIAALAHLAALGMITGTPGPVTVYQKNLLFKVAGTDDVLQDIRLTDPDIVFLQEVSDGNRAVLAGVSDRLPSQAVCDFTVWASVGVAARWPMLGAPVCAPGIAAIQVQSPDGPLWAVSLHLHWPWPFRQAGHLAELLPVLEGLQGPVVLGGDFNMVPTGSSVHQVARTLRVRRAGAVRRTIVKRGVPLAIDLVMAPGGGWTEVRGKHGSDHHGVLGRVWLEEPDNG